MKVSACIITLNEEQYIERAILSLKKIDLVEDIVVVDGGSHDKTVEICQRLGCNVVVNLWPNDFSIQRNLALSLCKNDWIIIADSDEWYPEKTSKLICEKLSNVSDNIGYFRLHEISDLGSNIGDATLTFEDLNKYCIGYSSVKNKHEKQLKFEIDGRIVVLTYSVRVVNKTKGRWVGRVHETFQLYDGYSFIILPEEYVIHHQKSMNRQFLSDARYDALIHNHCLYTPNYDDFINETSQKSVELFDEIFFKLVTEIFPCNKFVEVGAFDAQTSRHIQKVLPNAEIFAFEANPYNYNKFKSLFDNTTVNYLNVAISNKIDEVTFKIHTEVNGVKVSKIKGNDSLLFRNNDNVIYENVTMPSVTLDSYFLNKINNQDSVAMWIDLEGASYQALEGASNILSNVNIIKIEVENKELWKNQKLDIDIKLLLSQYGFVPVLRDYEYPHQYNILFCKNQIIESQQFKELFKNYNLQMNRGHGLGIINEMNRLRSIKHLYKTILNREADMEGLTNYHYSNFSIDEIKDILLRSDEYKILNVPQ